MHSIYRQVHPVTGTEMSVFCNFIDPFEKNLIVAGVNQLSVYRLNPDLDVSVLSGSKSQDRISDRDGKSKRMKLECVANFTLFGNIVSMQNVRLAGSMQDALLLSFRDAKMSLVEYDPGTHDLKTVSLHYFEDDDELRDGRSQHCVNLPMIRVDTDGRCAGMLIYGSRLVVLPFCKDISVENPDGTFTTGQTPGVLTSYIIDLRKLDERVTNIIDFQFLHGYYEPTVVILYEPLPTWAGRIAVRKDSCCIVAISLNIEQKVNPIIWSLTNLPFDCLQILAVPKPIGGILVFAVNSLLYLNQSFPPYGVSLNSITSSSTDFLLKVQEGVKITLDCAQACFITNDKLVISLRGGELYVLTLIADGMRAVRSFHMDKAAASVLTTCMCVCGEGYIFLGSRLGNSLLLRYNEKMVDLTTDNSISIDTQKDNPEEPANKRRKDMLLDDWADMDELEVYGMDSNQSSSQVTQYTFEVCDSIVNIGPCGQMVMGEPAFLSEEFHGLEDPDIELVTTSGYGKNGAISVLQRSTRPQVVTTFNLPGCTDMWTVVGGDKQNDDEQNDQDVDDEPGHTLLILSRQDSSMVLKTGQEIMELDHSGFITQAPTVFAGNIGNNMYVIQVSGMGVRLLQGSTNLQNIALDEGSPIVCCSMADPHVAIMSEGGRVILLCLKPPTLGTSPRLAITKFKDTENSKIITVCTYKDESGLFTSLSNRTGLMSSMNSQNKVAEDPTTKSNKLFEPDKKTVDDEDDLLYGDSGPLLNPFASNEKPSTSHPESFPHKEPTIKPATYWLALCRENGMFEIYSLPDFKLSFQARNFPFGNKVLVDTKQARDQMGRAGLGPEDKPSMQMEMPVIKELLLVGLGIRNSRPYIMARANDELLIYEAFGYQDGSSSVDDRLKIRFKRVNHGLILRIRRPLTGQGKDEPEVLPARDEEMDKRSRIRWLRPFEDISGYTGVFLCGPYPHWIFMTSRGILRIHPMGIDGTVTCFTPFHNVNCPKGFLYFNKQGELRISVLPTHVSYDAPWPVRKIPLRCTPYYVAYHLESKTYSVATSVTEPCNKLIKVVGDGEREFEVLERDDRFIYPALEKFSIQLFSPISWEAIPNTRYDMDEFERITCMQTINLRSEGTVSGMKGYIVAGTNYAHSEDVSSRGRVVILDVIEVVPEPGQPLTKNKFKVEYDKEQKGGVSAIEGVQGFLVTAIGQKIYIWQLKEGDLRGVAFIDAQIYVHCISSIKNLLLVGDVFKSITLLRYQEDMKVLSLVSRDVRPCDVCSIAFLIDNGDLSFLVNDMQKNLLVYSYLPEVRESHGGQRLLQRADFNIGSNINSMFRIRCRRTDPSTDRKSSSAIENRHVTYFATLDGSIGYLLPLSEKMYRRLLMLQNIMNVCIPHLAGLNPKAYRLVQNDYHQLSNPHKNILDGDLLWKFINLSFIERKEIAVRIGTSSDQIIADLMEVDRTTAHF